MGLPQWFRENWFLLLQGVGIVGGLIFAGVSLQVDARVRRIQNLLTLTEHHRDIWTRLYDQPDLFRLLRTHPKASAEPPTAEEELFVTLVILHLNTVYQAMKRGMFIEPEGLRRDLHTFFTRPIPQAIWHKLKALQDEDFVRFVEAVTQE